MNQRLYLRSSGGPAYSFATVPLHAPRAAARGADNDAAVGGAEPAAPDTSAIADALIASAGPVQGRRVRHEVQQAWRTPAGRLGFWVHLTTMAGPTVFGALWGYPYLTQALGYSPALAS